MFNEGYSFIRHFDEDRSESYVVIKHNVFTNYREVPLRFIRKCIKAAENEAIEDAE